MSHSRARMGAKEKPAVGKTPALTRLATSVQTLYLETGTLCCAPDEATCVLGPRVPDVGRGNVAYLQALEPCRRL